MKTRRPAIIALRADDGRGDPHPFLAEPDIGVWRPTPDLLLPMAVSWLGFVDPLVIDSSTQFAPPGPDPVDSADVRRGLQRGEGEGRPERIDPHG